MAGGPIFANSIYLGAGAGNLFPFFYQAATNTNNAGYDEGIGVIASLSNVASAILRYTMPPSIPTGTLKLRLLSQANATSGNVAVQIQDINLAAGSSPATANLLTETVFFRTWATADIYNENKVALSCSPSGNDILVVKMNFQGNVTWSLAAQSNWIPSVIWE